MTLTPQKRRLHLIDKHGYPRNYDFRIVETGLGDRISLLRGKPAKSSGRRRRVSDVGEPHWQTAGKAKITGKGRRNRRGTLDRPSEAENTNDGDDGAEADVEDEDEDEDEEELGSEMLQTPSRSVVSKFERGSRGPKSENSSDVDTLMSGMAALRFVPTSVRLKDRKPVE